MIEKLSAFSEPDRIEQIKSYGIGGGGITFGAATKSVGLGYDHIISLLQDGTIILGFLLVLVRLMIDIRRWWRGRKDSRHDG